MKFNKKHLLVLLTLFIVVLSTSCISAEDVEINDMNNIAIDNVNDISSVDSKTWSIPNGANQETIQQTIDNATAGDIINFDKNGVYKLDNNSESSKTIKVDKTLTFIGNNATITTGQGFYVQAGATTSIDGTSFTGFNFIMNNKNTWEGKAIEVRGGSDIKVNNCTFNGGNSGVYLRGVVGSIVVSNCYFNGTANATTITPKGAGETGTKCVAIMGGNKIKIINNTFVGTPLDAISIASNSKNIIVEGNIITGAYYGIFYGGGLVNITTKNNIFKDNKAYAIGLVKASQSSTITNNTIIMGTLPENGAYTSNAAIYLEQGNTAHGYATKIGDITIENNRFSIAEYVPANQTTYALEIMSNGGPLKLNGFLTVENNTYADNINKFIFLDKNWNYDSGDMDAQQYTDESIITPAKDSTTLKVGETELIQLTGADGTILVNQTITLTIMQNNKKIGNQTLTTNKFGIIEFTNNLAPGNYVINANYAGKTYNGVIYKETTKKFNITSIENNEKIYPKITGNSLVKYYRNASQYLITLTANGKPIANQTVYIFINGVLYTRTTNANGAAIMNINLAPGKYDIHLAFFENNKYYSYATKDTVTVLSPIVAQDLNMTASNRKPFTAKILNGQGAPDVGNEVSLNIHGVLYPRIVPANGVISLNINLAPGEYIITCYYPVRYASTADKTVTLAQSWKITVTN